MKSDITIAPFPARFPADVKNEVQETSINDSWLKCAYLCDLLMLLSKMEERVPGDLAFIPDGWPRHILSDMITEIQE